MANVNTVLGPIPSDALGTTLMHEHILIGMPGWDLDALLKINKRELIDRAVESLIELKALGVDTLVDPCPMELGRDPEVMAEVAQRSGINIICATGLYHEQAGIPAYMRYRTTEYLAELFVKEIEEGIGQTGIRPGIIKCATTVGQIGVHEEKVLRAAARAGLATGTPITTHTDKGQLGPEQCDIFAAEGMPLGNVVIGHSCGTADLSYHVRMLDRGANIGFDRFGIESIWPDRLRLAALIGLIGIGFAPQIVLSQDFVSCMMSPTSGSKRNGNDRWGGRLYLMNEVLPRLRAAGVPEEAIRQMLVEAPRRIFEHAATTPRVALHAATTA